MIKNKIKINRAAEVKNVRVIQNKKIKRINLLIIVAHKESINRQEMIEVIQKRNQNLMIVLIVKET